MDTSTLFEVDDFVHCDRYEAPVESPNGDVLIDSIYRFFSEESLKSSPFPTPLESHFPTVKTWTASPSDYAVSPALSELPTFVDESDDSSILSIPSPIGSLFSEYSNFNDPKTPPQDDKLSFHPIRRDPSSASAVTIKQGCSIRRGSKVTRKSSSATSVPRKGSVALSPINDNPEISTARLVSLCHATITNLVPLPEYVPSPNRCSFRVDLVDRPQLSITTRESAETLEQAPNQANPVLFLPRTTYNAPSPSKYVVPAPVTVRQPTTESTDTKEIPNATKVRRTKASRYSKALPPRPNSILHQFDSKTRDQENQQSIRVERARRSEEDPGRCKAAARVQRQWEIEHGLTSTEDKQAVEIQQEPEVQEPQTFGQERLDVEGFQDAVEPVTPNQKRLEIERIPDVFEPLLTPVRDFMGQGGWFTTDFFSGCEGMQIKMTRRVESFSKVQWLIESNTGSEILRGIGHSQSRSRRTDFCYTDESQICQFQKRTGSTKVAEAPDGTTLFTVKNASLYSSPHWTIYLGDDPMNTQWNANGDEGLQNVSVTWGGFQVGRISVESRRDKHTYILTVAPEMNYCVMAALTTVFDDLRTDEGC
ncbi:hypothetical protein PZA11_001940 [Diplocarpon coronariae]|uniref:Tubby C-terminal domain-containing protein n=1 Tax=Diplocarpon coronariae TaxID=2795749 RepID=A0A218Z7D6_9HELO|nr:hypothetical protein JHW43_001798 [Diplocarpon mali]OWP03530.1 hypothetical protein B2J93_7548 [Marssonina coronariae]